MNQNLSYIVIDPLRNNSPAIPSTYTSLEIIARRDLNLVSPRYPLYGNVYYVQPKPGKAFAQAQLPPTQRGYREESKTEIGDPYVLVTVSCFVPFESFSKHMTIETLMYEELILKVGTASGMIRIVGDQERGARFNFIYDTGDSYGKGLGHYGVFTLRMAGKPPFLYPDLKPGTDPGGPVGPGGSGG